MDNKKLPLSIILERSKGRFMRAFNEALEETQLPAYLVEGIVLELLSEVRSRKNLELMADYNAMTSKDETESG